MRDPIATGPGVLTAVLSIKKGQCRLWAPFFRKGGSGYPFIGLALVSPAQSSPVISLGAGESTAPRGKKRGRPKVKAA